jgi:hypothetical protein
MDRDVPPSQTNRLAGVTTTLIEPFFSRRAVADCRLGEAARESRLDPRKVITQRLPAGQFLEGAETMRRTDCGKIILDWAAA